MKSTLKFHNFDGFEFVTGTASIEDFERCPDMQPNGRPANWVTPCPPAVRQYDSEKAPFKAASAYFTERWKLNSELLEVLAELPDLLRELSRIFSVDFGHNRSEVGRVITARFEAKLRNVIKQESADERVREANEELQRWLREDKDRIVHEKLQEVIDRINESVEKLNANVIRHMSQDYVERIGNPGFWKADEDGHEKGDKMLAELDVEIKELRECLRDLENRKMVRRQELCDQWLNETDEIPQEFVERLREACRNYRPMRGHGGPPILG